MVAAILWLIFCLALLIGPFVLPLAAPVQLTIAAIGAVLLVLGSAVFLVTKLYVRTRANQAFVRTGRGGNLVVVDGGALVIPVLHEVVRVPLETIRLDVDRLGADALVTADKLRADLKAQFYIRVQPNSEDVLNAARSLGEKTFNLSAIEELVKDKLDSTLRSVAATRTLDELNANREGFAAEVKSAVEADLRFNGLTLESVTISKLDQTDTKLLNPNNVFDAQGLRRIAEITQQALVARNEIERAAEEARKQKDVATRLKILEQERIEAEAEAINKTRIAEAAAEEKARVAAVQAQKEAEARRVQIDQEQQVSQLEVEKERRLQEARLEAERQVLQVRREQEVAEVQKAQAVETAQRQKLAAIAEAEAVKAAMDRRRFEAEAERARAEQAVRTVEVTAEAERDAEKSLIAARKAAEQDRYRKQVEADVVAYAIQKEAEAKKAAAEAEFAARVRAAEAEASAAARKAEAETALSMVPVNVKQRELDLEHVRVELENRRNQLQIQMLESREKFEKAALDFELAKLRIEAERDAKVEIAQALGQFLAKGNFNLIGDPTAAQKMIESYLKGMGLGRTLDGFFEGVEGQAASQFLSDTGLSVSELMKGLGARLASARNEPSAE